MLTTGLLDKITGVLSGQILLSGLLPALLTLGYGLLFATRLGGLPLAEIFASQLTLPALLVALYLIAVTLLFESFLNPLLLRWLCGDAFWFPAAATLIQAQERQQLDELVYRESERRSVWSKKRAELEQTLASVRRAAGKPSAGLPSPAPDPARIDAIRAIRDQARRSVPDLRNLEPPDTLVARLCAEYQEPGAIHRLAELDQAYLALQALLASVSRALDGVYGELQRELVTRFPTRDRLRPTRFGNRMAAIDSYAATHYGIDGVLVWPLLRRMAPSSSGWAQLEAAQGRLDFAVAAFWIHLAMLAAALLALPTLWAWDPALLVFSVTGGAIGGIVFHSAALQTLTAYGLQVRATFDLHRWELLDALHLPRPTNAETEYELWSSLGDFLLYAPLASELRRRWYR